jgi:hypothetical protein
VADGWLECAAAQSCVRGLVTIVKAAAISVIYMLASLPAFAIILAWASLS